MQLHSRNMSRLVHVTGPMQVMKLQAHQLEYCEMAVVVAHQESEAPQDCLIVMPQAHDAAICWVYSTQSLLLCWQLEQTLAQLLQFPHIHALCEECMSAVNVQFLKNPFSSECTSVVASCRVQCTDVLGRPNAHWAAFW